MSDHASIARERVYGADIWAYGGGGARVRPWTEPQHYSRFWGEAE